MRLLSAPLLAALALLAAPAAHANTYYFGLGGWGYDVEGSVNNSGGTTFDFQRDLDLKASNRKELTLGYRPAKFGWVPGVDFSYLRIEARGRQMATATSVFGTVIIPAGAPIENATGINDFDASIRWPYTLGPVTMSAGLTVARLDGKVTLGNGNTNVADAQEIDETFPLASLGLAYAPLPALRLAVRGDYIESGGSKAQTLEGSLLYKFFGPVGLELGYRERRFKIVDGNSLYDARLSGARLALRMEIP